MNITAIFKLWFMLRKYLSQDERMRNEINEEVEHERQDY